MPRFVLRKLGIAGAIASALLVGSLAGLGGQPAFAQLFSGGFQFLEAVKEREGETVTQMLNEPGTQVVNTRDLTSGDTGLHICAQRRDHLWIKFLIQRDADPNIRNKKGITPLQVSVSLGDIDSVEALIKGGANVNVADQQGETPLIAAVNARDTEMVARLLKEGADPDRNDYSGRSARDYASLMKSNTQLMQEFEEADKDRKGKGTVKTYGPSF